MVFNEQPTDPWKRGDRKLLEAYEIKQKETCGHCGNPIWLCHSENSELLWEVQTTNCYANNALKDWHKNHAESKENPYAVPYVLTYEGRRPVPDYKNLPTRKQFFEERADD